MWMSKQHSRQEQCPKRVLLKMMPVTSARMRWRALLLPLIAMELPVLKWGRSLVYIAGTLAELVSLMWMRHLQHQCLVHMRPLPRDLCSNHCLLLLRGVQIAIVISCWHPVGAPHARLLNLCTCESASLEGSSFIAGHG